MHRSMIATALAIATVSATPALAFASEDDMDDVIVSRNLQNVARRRNCVIAEGVARAAYQCKAEMTLVTDERLRGIAAWVLRQYLAEIDGE